MLCAAVQCFCVLCYCDVMSAILQGDKEKAAGLAVSPLMDRSLQGGMTRSQVSF